MVVRLIFQVAKKHKLLTRKHVTAQLTEQPCISKRVHFKRNDTIVSNCDAQWQVDMQLFSKHNSGYNYKYILTVTDIQSKYAWALALKRKIGQKVSKAFKYIFYTR